jgi:hypothetical protein
MGDCVKLNDAQLVTDELSLHCVSAVGVSEQ